MPTPDAFDPVLAVVRPDLTPDEAIAAAHTTFGIRATAARSLGSERDQTFLLERAEGTAVVLKVSNEAEDASTLDMEAHAVLHAARVDPTLPLALPWPVPGAALDDPDPAVRRVRLERAGRRHFVRAYDLLPGQRRPDPRVLTDAALVAWGATTARLGRALRGCFHPAAGRTMLWDVQHAARTRAFLPAIRDARHRDLVERVLDRYDEVVAPVWPSLRAQLVHTDMDPGNVILDDAGLITGIVDFGDASHSALVVDVAAPMTSLPEGRRGDEILRVGRLVLDGYQRHTPLEPEELRILGELIATRAAVTIAIPSWRIAAGLVTLDALDIDYTESATLIETILTHGWDDVARGFGAEVPVARTARAPLVDRRQRTMGPALEPLSYDEPLLLERAQGVWMWDADGRRFLDAYNNVPCVGHAHPRVTEAIARQARRLNTNLRYLHPLAVELAERLIATLPPGLDTVFYVNSGSEANDLAWRLATTVTGRRGGLCTDIAYHGISEAIAPLSPESWPPGRPPAHIERWAATDDPGAVQAAIERLRARDVEPAVAILDGVLTSDGYPTITPDTAEAWLGAARRAGALWIADEVQGGHGRTGEAMWSFERLGLVPDIVTLGKPMGNGHPVGAVITRRDIAQAFADETVFFSTFGGNPVSMAASLAVLDVLSDERVMGRTVLAGDVLRAAIREAAGGHPAITEVRGVGLATGVETPDGATARAVKEGLRQAGVLIGTSGPGGRVLKIRPPLAFTTAEVPVLADALRQVLATLEAPARA